ncbi:MULTISPECIES: ABC-three component system middle component 6 [spotted fever group]|uniref:ABC-three component system middle component 6 n=2 Tax=Rickettsia TaxID=780 RepID=UPI0001A6037A|nr:ABC-three component system middle component 6 [Rickettsia endosymbiont of Ixodes scapularis]EER22149.1 hypothetical protein REIS_1354 [Rickettsia endosymbiont of Ixodes scapularis]
MILPTTLIEEEDTLLRSGTYLLEILGEQMDITSLWKKTKEIQSIETFDRFTLGLVLLFCFGLVDMEENLMSPFGDKKSLAFRRREDIMKLL